MLFVDLGSQSTACFYRAHGVRRLCPFIPLRTFSILLDEIAIPSLTCRLVFPAFLSSLCIHRAFNFSSAFNSLFILEIILMRSLVLFIRSIGSVRSPIKVNRTNLRFGKRVESPAQRAFMYGNSNFTHCFSIDCLAYIDRLFIVKAEMQSLSFHCERYFRTTQRYKTNNQN